MHATPTHSTARAGQNAAPMGFEVDIGYSSASGPREVNEDFAGAVVAPVHDAARGLVAAIADGVSTGGGGRDAAQTAVMSLLEDFHAVPATWETTVALERLIGSHNAWLADHNRRRGDGRSGLAALTACVLQGHTWTVAQVGDTRAWLLRDGELTQITQDHVLDHPDLRSRLTRAIGLDDTVRVDYFQGELQAGDTLLLTSDGVHQVLRRARLGELAGAGRAQAASDALVRAALDEGGRDNATALVLRVHGLASARLQDTLVLGRTLPPLPRLKLGDVVDGHVVTALVADTGVHRIAQARVEATRELVAIKYLHESRAGDPEERAMLAHEAWLGRAVAAVPGFVRVREVPGASAFYIVFDWHAGATLEQMLAAGRPFTTAEVVVAALAVARALGRLHRLHVVHRDVKPGNLHLGEDGQWRLLDLGVAVSGREPAGQRSLHAGTPSYMNPEQWDDEGAHAAPDAMSDLYALGVVLYQWLAGRLPYGEIEPYQTARYRRDPVPPSRLKPEVPIWLDHVVLKAVARERAQRFETAEELVLALERGASRPLAAPPATPLVARDPQALWKIALAVSLMFNLLLVVWLLFLPR
jgi:serine/threonine protein phosphatase PrpC